MENIVIEVEKRNEKEIKNKVSKKLKAKNYIPAVVYGLKKDPVSIKVKEKEFKDIVKGKSIYSAIFNLKMDSSKKSSKETVLIKEFQRDAITREFLHIDFLRIKMKKEIETAVPIHILNEEIAVGIKEKGGVLQHGLRELHISCLPVDIPDYIGYDITELDMGSAVRVSDINVSDKIKILNDPEEIVVSVIHPTQLKEEEEEVEEEELGEEELGEEKLEEPEVIGKGKEEQEPEEEKGHKEEKGSSEK
ncbi:MAG: 50S ribosomal protein L25 [Actinomycetota bacterium]|nr:50S ribosomal protein L25 [Actinomycetota bacterium]